MNRPLLMLMLINMLASATVIGQTKVYYPASESDVDTRFADVIEILRTALDLTVADYGAYSLEPSATGMNEARALSELRDPMGRINVMWSGTSIEKERNYYALKIPLRKGILGYRVALIAKDRQADIDKLLNVEDLRNFSIGQGFGWGDVAIYRANGNLVYIATYENLFKMVAQGRVDLFPRGINEIFTEFAAHKDNSPKLAIEKNLLIYYPWPYYFFFNKSNEALAQRVEAGIRMMMKDGSFDALFRKYNQASIENINYEQRRIIRMNNPNLPKQTPLDDASLWFDPATWK